MTDLLDSTGVAGFLPAQTENVPGATEDMPSPSLYEMISTYWKRYDVLMKAMNAAEATKGSADQAAAAEVERSACDYLDESAIAICGYVPVWRTEASIKASFLGELAARNGGMLTEEELQALIESTAGLVDHRAREGGAA